MSRAETFDPGKEEPLRTRKYFGKDLKARTNGRWFSNHLKHGEIFGLLGVTSIGYSFTMQYLALVVEWRWKWLAACWDSSSYRWSIKIAGSVVSDSNIFSYQEVCWRVGPWWPSGKKRWRTACVAWSPGVSIILRQIFTTLGFHLPCLQISTMKRNRHLCLVRDSPGRDVSCPRHQKTLFFWSFCELLEWFFYGFHKKCETNVDPTQTIADLAEL